ncbi:MAG: hypothetical protein EPO64_10855 [Nitrospirae bacterium]|nr:MAG: hypothetical protein EPO64_10855 [Nitrospirota bacterium]
MQSPEIDRGVNGRSGRRLQQRDRLALSSRVRLPFDLSRAPSTDTDGAALGRRPSGDRGIDRRDRGAACAWLLVDLRDRPSDLQRAGIAAVIFAFLVFGTESIAQGVLQLVRGRRSQVLLRIMVVIAILEVIASVFL